MDIRASRLTETAQTSPPNHFPVFDYLLRLIRLSFASLVLLFILPLLIVFKRDLISYVLRRYFEFCGGMFIKFGQIIATRNDILPQYYTEQLMGLLDQIQPIKTESILSIIEADMGTSVSTHFNKFEHVPLGVGSIAHLLRAQLQNVDEVVVKVKRPNIQKNLHVDSFVLRFLAKLLEKLGAFPHIKISFLVNEMLQAIQQECDFYQESRNIELFEQVMREDNIAHRVPRCYPQLSSKSVIVMEYVDGIRLYEILDALEVNDVYQLAIWREQGINAALIAKNLLSSVVVQCFRHQMFHGDLHPANIIILPDNELVYVDLGRIGWIDKQQQLQNFRIYRHLLTGDLHQAYDGLLEMLKITPKSDLEAFEYDVKDLLQQWLWNTNSVKIPVKQRNMTNLLFQLFALTYKHQLRVPTMSVNLYYVLSTVDTMILQLSPTSNRLTQFQTLIADEAHYQQRLYLEQLGQPEGFMTMLGSVASTLNEVRYFLRQSRLRSSYQTPTQAPFSLLPIIRNGLLLFGVLLFAAKWVVPNWYTNTIIETLLLNIGNNWWLLASGAIFLGLSIRAD